MLRKELLSKNKDIFVAAGKALDQYAKKECKVLVVANPANTNCLVCAMNAPSIPRENFSALTRLDMNRARSMIAAKLSKNVGQVKNVVIWGNHSSTQVPDAFIATVESEGKEVSVSSALEADAETFLTTEFFKSVQGRGAAVIEKRGLSSALSAANAIKDHIRDWVLGTSEEELVSMAVISDGSYGVAKDIVFSFPVTCRGGKYSIVQGLTLHSRVKEAIKVTEKELLEEKEEALGH
jgi:malate dehydrogenase